MWVRGATVDCVFTDCSFNGDTSYAQGVGISEGSGCLHNVRFYNCNFGVASTGKTTHSGADISRTGYVGIGDIAYFYNCKLASTPSGVLSYVTYVQPEGFGIFFSDWNNIANTHCSYMRGGTISSDAVIYRTAPRSVRLIPAYASIRHKNWPTKKVAIKSGQTTTVSVYVRESVIGDGTDYNGARARLMIRRTDRLGITTDTVLATATAASEGTWEKLTAVTPTASKDGVFEFYVDCTGTTGWINVQDWEVA
jgi:hypothetical protein